MQMFKYTIEAIATTGQSDAGNIRAMEVIAYAPSQALAWARRDFGRYATVTGIVHTEEYNGRGS